jgi:hypothetical protein
VPFRKKRGIPPGAGPKLKENESLLLGVFPYVCPEPVLVEGSFVGESGGFLTCREGLALAAAWHAHARAKLIHTCQPAAREKPRAKSGWALLLLLLLLLLQQSWLGGCR